MTSKLFDSSDRFFPARSSKSLLWGEGEGRCVEALGYDEIPGCCVIV